MSSPTSSPRKRGGCLKIGLIVGVLLLVGAVAVWAWNNRPIKAVELDQREKEAIGEKLETLEERSYEEGGKVIRFTERELNGLLNEHTQLGDKVKLEIADGAVHARIETKLDPNFPVAGGKTVKGRARFLIDFEAERPELVLDDVTVYGISVPNDWLAGLKGQNLLDQLFGGEGGLSGVQSIALKNGEIVITLKD